jgi:hypothetical protein
VAARERTAPEKAAQKSGRNFSTWVPTVRNEIFKEIWSEIDRLDRQSVAARSATTRSSSAN